MAKVAWRGEMKQLRMRIENLPEEMLDLAEDIMQDTMEDGADLMRKHIRTRGTAKSDKEGRIESGAMLDAVDSAVHRNPRSVRGEFGWGVNGGDNKPYFHYQENGFRHWISGEHIPPMHAFLDAFIRTRTEFFARMRREMGSGRR